MLEHGGRLRTAAARYGIALEQWLDLSTGINPNGWPVPAIPAACWARLPEDDDGLDQAAQSYYEAEHVLPVAGSQAAIQALPQLRPRSRVAVLDPGYAEHTYAWRCAGHEVTGVAVEHLDAAMQDSDVLVLIHPNNPTGARFPVVQLLHWHARLAARGGWLVVDEAFMDVTPEHSLCGYSARPGLIVLRSLGKFFGLAGVRVGFVCAQASLLAQLHGIIGPWSVSTPARWVAGAALADRAWQVAARRRLSTEGARLQALLAQHGLIPDEFRGHGPLLQKSPVVGAGHARDHGQSHPSAGAGHARDPRQSPSYPGGCALFQWVRTPDAQDLHEALARQGILTRLFIEPRSLRFGLPGDEAGWTRLEAALSELGKSHEEGRGHGPLLQKQDPLNVVGAGHARDKPHPATTTVGAGNARDKTHGGSITLKPGHASLRRGRVSLPNHVYIVTTATYDREKLFLDFEAAAEACRCMHDPALLGDATLLAWVVMPDHAHWLLQLGEKDDLARVVNRIKSASARRVNRVLKRRGRLWSAAYHDRVLREEEDLRGVARYVIANPLRAGIVRQVGDYPFWNTVWL